MPFATRLVVADQSVRFVTGHRPAFEYMLTRDNLAGIKPFRCLPDDPGLDMPTVSYREGGPRGASFDAATCRLDVTFPWEEEAPELFAAGKPYRNLLLYPVRMALEWVRQEQSEYTVHASAVTRDGQAIVFSGDAEAGKTTTALHLCHGSRFAMYSNDQTVLSTREGRPWLVRGDREVSVRLSSIARYSSTIADRIFTDGAAEEAWDVKKDVGRQELGLESAEGPVPLKLFVRIRLDDTLDDCVVHVLSDRLIRGMTPRQRRIVFHTKLALYGEITALIRGAAFTPLRDADLSLLDMYLPSLDNARFVAKRAEFMNLLFGDERMAVVSVRGPLDACGRAVLRLFEGAPPLG